VLAFAPPRCREENYTASGRAVGVTGEVFLDKPIVEQYRRLLRNAGELDD
jgi:hypothetical protein